MCIYSKASAGEKRRGDERSKVGEWEERLIKTIYQNSFMESLSCIRWVHPALPLFNRSCS